MAEIKKSRDLYKYGTPEAQEGRDGERPEPTFIVRICDGALLVFLFGAHLMYRDRLQRTSAKGLVYIPDFQAVMQDLLVEWAGTQFNLNFHEN